MKNLAANTVNRIDLSLQIADDLPDRAGVPKAALIKRVAQLVGNRLRRKAVVTIRFVGAREGRALNRDFRGKDYTTNVLTFVYDATPRKPIVGDIVIAPSIVAEEARDQGKSLEHHYTHLLIHGLLHLYGFDHEVDADAEEMEALEARLLATFGIANPYE
jgi:probable rRNA maturation factor